MTIRDRIATLKADILAERLSLEEIFHKHIVDSPPYFFESVAKSTELEYKVKTIIADALDIHLNEIVIVGSSRIGYSLNPRKLFAPFDSKFHQTTKKRDKSDLDIAIVSSDFFKALNVRMYEFTKAFSDSWATNEYYSSPTANPFPVPINFKFYEYHTKGWFRPDFKPIGFEFCLNRTYEEIKMEINQITGRKLSLGIYKSWYYFKNYHLENLKMLQNLMKTETV